MAQQWLDVPYAEKDEAKAAGARWNPRARRWYAPRPEMDGLARWAPRPPLPDVLPGEDRRFGGGLFVDLVPSSCWFTNVRSCIAPVDWERLRRMIVDRAGERCEACAAAPDRDTGRWLEAHERWEYREDPEHGRVQALRRIVCLCTSCHRATHFGFAEVKGVADEALAHLCEVNGWAASDAREHVEGAYELWAQRSRHTWTLDLALLTDAGITLAPPPVASERPGAAGAALRATRSVPEPLRWPSPR